MTKKAFTLIEILMVVMLISAGILPIYTLMTSGSKRIKRADTRIIATLFGTSAIEVVKTYGYAKVYKKNLDVNDIANDHNWKELAEIIKTANKNGFNLTLQKTIQSVSPLPKGAMPTSLVRVVVNIAPTHKKIKNKSDGKVLTFMTILTDPRYNFY